MIWLTWRQMRVQAAAAYAGVVAAAAVLALTGPRLAVLARANTNVYDRLTATDRQLFYAGIAVMAVIPAILGVFWGAPLVARELETGTHRLAWNQSITRTRWLATKLGVTTIAATAATGLLALAITWWSRPLDGVVSSGRGSFPSRLTPVSFAMRGIAPVGYTVFALVLGVTLGIVLRRSVPAMAITLVVFLSVQVAMALWVRPQLIPPTRQTLSFVEAHLDTITADGEGRPVALTLATGTRGDWVLSNRTVDAAGRTAALPSWLGDCVPAPSESPSGRATARPLDACMARLAAEGYHQRLILQPASRFWPLQWLETGVFLVLSALLSLVSFWWTRTRLS